MLSTFKKLFSSNRASRRLDDVDFGAIRYVQPLKKYPHGYWRMDGDWKVPFQPQPISCSEIPGDERGPSSEARAFLLEKRDAHEFMWRIAESQLHELMSGWSSFDNLKPREAFFIASVAMDSDKPDGWEVCFQTKDTLKWFYFCLQVRGEQVVSNSVDT
jgi:hypothetical protein